MRGCVLVWAVLLWLLAAGTAVAAAPLSSDAIGGSIVRPPSGLYVLDRAIGFNVLDAAAIDPKSGRIMLVGHRDKRYGDAQIPYLELLATLVDCPAPKFRLLDASQSEPMLRSFFAGPPGDRIIDDFGQLFASGEANADALRLLGLPAGADRSQIEAAIVATTGPLDSTRGSPAFLPDAMRRKLFTVWSSADGMEIGPSALASTLGLRYEIRPDYIALDTNSLLARTMFEADYVSKHLIYSPQLEAMVPGYITKFASERSEDAKLGRVELTRLWFSIARLGLAQSTDGLTIETRNVSMRVNMRSFEPNDRLGPLQLSSPNERPTPYEARLTSLYPELEYQLPALHELSECAKLAAVARWLHALDPSLRLPQAGRTNWSAPKSVPGILYAVLSVPPGGLTTTKLLLRVHLVAEGGVSLDPFPGESGLPHIDADPVVLDLNKTALATPPTLSGLPRGNKAVAWVTNVPGEMPYQVAVAGVSDISGDLAGSTGTTRGPFGESQPVPNLAPANYPSARSDTTALDQVRSGTASGGAARVAAIAVDASGNARLAFDTSGGPGASMPAPPPTQLGSPSEKIPAAVWNDKTFQQLLGETRHLDGQGAHVQAQIKQQEQVVASAPPDQKSSEEVKLSELYQQKSDIDSQKAYVNFEARKEFNVDVTVAETAPATGAPTASPSN